MAGANGDVGTAIACNHCDWTSVDCMHDARLSRRHFIQLGLSGSAVLVLPAGCGDSHRMDGAPGEAGRFFDTHQYETVRALTGSVIPEDRDPGAASAHVVDYIDFLLGAFLVDPPRIHAAGPFSGRHGGDGSFDVYLPLSRVKEIAWRNHIEGSQGIPEREFNGPVKGLQQLYREGIEWLDARARAEHGADFKALEPAQQGAIFQAADAELIDAVYAHTVEGMYAAPEYGGNFDQLGWGYIGYEGDRQPLGYTRRQVEEPDPGEASAAPDEPQQAEAIVERLRATWAARGRRLAQRGAAR